MSTSPEFFDVAEYELGECFPKTGFVIQAAEDLESLVKNRIVVTAIAGAHLGVESIEADVCLNNIHKNVSVEDLNNLRLRVIGRLNVELMSRPRYYSPTRKLHSALVGVEQITQV